MVSIEDSQVNAFVFHPRPEVPGAPGAAIATETTVDGAVVGGYLHSNPDSDTLMLFFHGNGEIAADYETLAHLYTGCGASFWVVDYRGYGRSTGAPSFVRMRSDAEAVLDGVPAIEAASGIRFARVVVMGRSLGSASAIHLAAARPGKVHGLVLDSSFADGPALVRRLGGPEVDPALTPGFEDNIDQIRSCKVPVLLIHGTEDWIIPVSDAEALYQASPSAEKRLVKIRGAGHNDLLVQGYGTYFSEIRTFLETIRPANR